MNVIARPFNLLHTAANTGAGATVNLAVLATTANVTVSPTLGAYRACRILNSGTNIVYINLGPAATVNATIANSFPMLPNTERVFWFHNDWDTVAAICSAPATNTIYVTMGEGAI